MAPESEYYKGHGTEVMRKMQARYGKKAGKRVFYATANKRGLNRPGKKNRKKSSGKRSGK